MTIDFYYEILHFQKSVLLFYCTKSVQLIARCIFSEKGENKKWTCHVTGTGVNASNKFGFLISSDKSPLKCVLTYAAFYRVVFATGTITILAFSSPFRCKISHSIKDVICGAFDVFFTWCSLWYFAPWSARKIVSSMVCQSFKSVETTFTGIYCHEFVFSSCYYCLERDEYVFLSQIASRGSNDVTIERSKYVPVELDGLTRIHWRV